MSPDWKKTDSHRRNKKIYGAIAVVLAAAAIWFIWHSVGLYRQKKAAEAAGAFAAEAAEQSGDAAASEDPNAIPGGGIRLPDGSISFGGKIYERDPSVKAILCIGVDTSGELDKKVSAAAGQADGLFLAAHDVARKSVKILMIPRDTMTPIILTDLRGNILGKDVQHITLAYAYGDGQQLSCERTRDAVSELLGGLQIDGYLAMNMTMISELNDLAGGVTVQIDIDGMEKRDPALTKGSTVTLTGKQAEIFVRYRDTNVDGSPITRMGQQRQYMEKYLEAVRRQAAKDDQTVVRIMDAVETHMLTDMPKDAYMNMGLSIINGKEPFTQEDIYTIPGTVTTELFDEFHHDPAGTLQMVLDLFYREKA